MPYLITHRPRARIPAVQPRTITRESAQEAWEAYEGLTRSDEECEVSGPHGHLGREELKRLAEEEARERG
jgi:hypothetical protein